MRAAIPFITLLACMRGMAQSPTPAFDAASVHPSQTMQKGGSVQTSPGLLTVRNQSLRSCIQWAYGLPPFRFTGPAWLDDTRFDIVARAAGAADEDHLRLMLRTLLAERFGLKVHTEQKEMQVYALTIAKTGPKFHESTTDGPPVFTNGGKGILAAERVNMKEPAEKIAEPLGRRVINATGLKGRYDLHVDITPYMLSSAGGGGTDNVDVMSVMFTALQEQLGVRLESRKDSPEILVVDHAEKRPTEN